MREFESQAQGQDPSDDELFGLFERRRPKPESFADRIRERVEELEREHDQDADPSEDDQVVRSSPWTKVAASLSVKPTGFKIASAAFVWPLLLLVASMGGLYYGRRSLAKSFEAGGDQPARTSGKSSKTRVERSMGLKWLSLFVFFAPLLALILGGSWGLDLILVIALFAMLGLVLVVREFGSDGAVTRAEVMPIVVVVIVGLLVSGAFVQSSWSGMVNHVGPARGWALVALVAGASLCTWLSADRIRSRLFVVWGLVIIGFMNPFSFTKTYPAELYSQLETIAERLDVDELDLWEEAAAIHGALESVDAKTPNLKSLSSAVADRIEGGGDIHPIVWTASIDMGLLGDEELVSLAELDAHAIERLRKNIAWNLAGKERRSISSTTYNHYVVLLLLATEGLEEPQRDELLQMVLDLWPDLGEFHGLEKAMACIKLLEALGRDDLVEELRGPARELLSEYWVSPARSDWSDTGGGFMSQPLEHTHSSDEPTLQAVQLMARFGIPEDVDAFLLRGYLRLEASQSVVGGCSPFARYHLDAKFEAALFRLERQVGMPERSWLAWFFAQRILFVILAVVALCVSAVLMAPKSLEQVLDEGKGAMP